MGPWNIAKAKIERQQVPQLHLTISGVVQYSMEISVSTIKKTVRENNN